MLARTTTAARIAAAWAATNAATACRRQRFAGEGEDETVVNGRVSVAVVVAGRSASSRRSETRAQTVSQAASSGSAGRVALQSRVRAASHSTCEAMRASGEVLGQGRAVGFRLGRGLREREVVALEIGNGLSINFAPGTVVCRIRPSDGWSGLVEG